MINPNELRIGNKVYGPSKKDIGLVEGVGLGVTIRLPSGHTDIYNADQLNGIPLTEEWLLKFGFETSDSEIDYMEYSLTNNNGESKIKIGNDGGIHNHNNQPFYFSINGEQHGWSTEFKQEIKYVHQLQNLYFALTGNELGIYESHFDFELRKIINFDKTTKK